MSLSIEITNYQKQDDFKVQFLLKAKKEIPTPKLILLGCLIMTLGGEGGAEVLKVWLYDEYQHLE